MIDVHEQQQCAVLGVGRVPIESITRFGSIKIGAQEGNVYEVADLVENPNVDEAPSDLAVMGRYVLSPAIFDSLRRTEPGAGGEIQLTDGINNLLGQHKVIALDYDDDYFDVVTL